MSESLRKSAVEDLSSRISTWLSPPDPSSNFEAARKKRQPDTGLWLLEGPIYTKWKQTPSSFLWLYGKAGSGKTVLSSTVVHSLREENRDKNSIVYFYFDFQTQAKQLVDGFAKSIVVQLFDQNPQTLKILEEFYNSHSKGRSSPTIDDLKVTIRRMVNKCKPMCLVVDALDECEDRECLLEFLEDSRGWTHDNYHILATSRRETDIEDSLSVVATDKVSLEESVVDEDILKYVQYQLHHDSKLSKWRPEVRKEIEEALVNGANGMFRWVECQLDAVRRCLKLGLLRSTLKTLPKTLDETYTRILDRVPEEYMEDVHRILSCLVYSFHPLDIQEVAETIAIVDEGDEYYDVENRLSEARDILTICSGLVTTTRSVRHAWYMTAQKNIHELRLAHFSVKEYLVSNRIKTSKTSTFFLSDHQTHEYLARLCIRYLYYCNRNVLPIESQLLLDYDANYLDKAAFTPYAASFWSTHLQAAKLDGSSPLYSECVRMLRDPGFMKDLVWLRRPWFEFDEFLFMVECGCMNYHNGEYWLKSPDGTVPPLYYVSLLGIDQLVTLLLDAGEDVDSSCSQGTCLEAAAIRGHTSTVGLLLERGVDIDKVILQSNKEKEITYSRSPLLAAVENKHETITEMLLSKGADLNVARCPWGNRPQGLEFNTPLQAAVHYWQEDLVLRMLEEGADPNAWGGQHGTAYEDVPNNSHKAKILLDAGADPNLVTKGIGKGINA